MCISIISVLEYPKPYLYQSIVYYWFMLTEDVRFRKYNSGFCWVCISLRDPIQHYQFFDLQTNNINWISDVLGVYDDRRLVLPSTIPKHGAKVNIIKGGFNARFSHVFMKRWERLWHAKCLVNIVISRLLFVWRSIENR